MWPAACAIVSRPSSRAYLGWLWSQSVCRGVCPCSRPGSPAAVVSWSLTSSYPRIVTPLAHSLGPRPSHHHFATSSPRRGLAFARPACTLCPRPSVHSPTPRHVRLRPVPPLHTHGPSIHYARRLLSPPSTLHAYGASPARHLAGLYLLACSLLRAAIRAVDVVRSSLACRGLPAWSLCCHLASLYRLLAPPLPILTLPCPSRALPRSSMHRGGYGGRGREEGRVDRVAVRVDSSSRLPCPVEWARRSSVDEA